MSNIEDYFFKLKEKISEKELNDFWLVDGRSDFKPIKQVTKKDIQKFIKI